jgi:hypothetical protein
MTNFTSTYPNIAKWTESYGWIEIGYDDNTDTFIRVLDEGGMVWESKPKYKSLDEALNDLETALEKIIDEIG